MKPTKARRLTVMCRIESLESSCKKTAAYHTELLERCLNEIASLRCELARSKSLENWDRVQSLIWGQAQKNLQLERDLGRSDEALRAAAARVLKLEAASSKKRSPRK